MFNTLVGILAGSVLLLELSDFIIISSGSVGDKRIVCKAGLSRKSWYLVPVFIILSSIFCATVQRNLLKKYTILKGLVNS